VALAAKLKNESKKVVRKNSFCVIYSAKTDRM